MRNYLSENTTSLLNNLLKELFKANSVADNIAYNLQKLKCYNTSKIYHENFAHIWPVLADKCTTTMDKLGAKAERMSFEGNVEVYDNIAQCFNETVKLVEKIRAEILKDLEVLNYDINNKEIILMLESLLEDVLNQLYKVNVWNDFAEYYYNKDKVMEFDTKFDDFFEE